VVFILVVRDAVVVDVGVIRVADGVVVVVRIGAVADGVVVVVSITLIEGTVLSKSSSSTGQAGVAVGVGVRTSSSERADVAASALWAVAPTRPLTLGSADEGKEGAARRGLNYRACHRVNQADVGKVCELSGAVESTT
jgi:hypothetical protein